MEEDCLMKPSVSIRVHPWFYSTVYNSLCKILEEQALWRKLFFSTRLLTKSLFLMRIAKGSECDHE